MSSTPISIPYDPDRWIQVPLDFTDSAWADAAAWAAWLADQATRGRSDAAELAEAIERNGRERAEFPADSVSARFWHYPTDGSPTGWVDVFVQARDDDGVAPEELLPELGFTVVAPVIEPAANVVFRAAVRRLSLTAIQPDPDRDPVVFPKAEWLGIGDGWVGYAVSGDHDLSELRSRLLDIDELFRTLDPGLTR